MNAAQQPELPFDPRPDLIVTDYASEFFALCARDDLRIESIERGEGNGQWLCRVKWEREWRTA
jgi:hypothetical protein